MFNLLPSELDCAKEAIDHHGYSTLLPRPPEWDDVDKHWDAVRGYLCGLDLTDYTPRQPLPIMVAKDEKSVRYVHLLHPEDMLLYTSLTLIVKDDIERARLPRTKQRVYSYRASRKSTRLYRSVRDTHQEYMKQIRRKVEKQSTRTVVVTDIADFYASVSQTHLKRLLKAAAHTPRIKIAAELLISVFAASFMARQGHGIPTGPLASRLLAEVFLNEVDKHLMSRRVDFVRWVDDYNVFAPSLAAANSTLLDLAAWLYGVGLTLQAAKTHVLEKDTYARRFLVDFKDKLSDREAILAALLHANYYEPDELPEDVDDFMDDLPAVQLLEVLVDAISSDDRIDNAVIGFVVRKLRTKSLDRVVAHEVLEVLVENIERLSPVIAEVAPLVIRLIGRGEMSERMGKRLLGSMARVRVDHYAVWILTIFAERGSRRFVEALTDLYEATESDVVRRHAALAVGRSGGRIQVEGRKWGQFAPLVRLAVLKVGGSPKKGTMRQLGGKLEQLVVSGSANGP